MIEKLLEKMIKNSKNGWMKMTYFLLAGFGGWRWK
jgi:hypothetical protein